MESVGKTVPWKTVEDYGGACMMGTIGSGVSQAIKGFQHSSVGVNQRQGSFVANIMRPP